jgi:hypothetical protein
VKIDWKSQTKDLVVSLDAEGKGSFTACLTKRFTDAQVGNMSGAHLAITASTGQLADNHDILELSLSHHGAADPSTATAAPQITELQKLEAAVDPAVAKLIKAYVAVLREEQTALDHEVEHTLASVTDGLNVAIRKIQDAEKDDAARLAELEQRVLDRTSKDTKKIVNAKVKQEISRKSRDLHQAMNEAKKAARKMVEESIGGWKLPFLVIFGMVVGLGFVGWKKYRRIMKTHLP